MPQTVNGDEIGESDVLDNILVKDLYHEVLFTEWIPRTFDLEGATFEFSARESSEVGELVVNFNNVIDLNTDYGHR